VQICKDSLRLLPGIENVFVRQKATALSITLDENVKFEIDLDSS